jgi:hypothetical protein
MALRLARGLFRLWFVLTIFWFWLVWAFLAPKVPNQWSGIHLQRSESRPSQCAGEDSYKCASILQQLGRCEGSSESEWCALDDADLGIEDPGPEWLRTVGEMALVPPALLLLVGSAFGVGV